MLTKQEKGVLSERDVLRFREHVEWLDSGCRDWTGARNKQGYGKFGFMRRLEDTTEKATKPAHHAAFFIAHGRWPRAGSVIMHTCDRPSCVNPEHLAEGTFRANSADMVSKGRQCKGGAHYRAKLSAADVLLIRERYAAGGVTQSQLSKEFGVNSPNINQIINRVTWTHI